MKEVPTVLYETIDGKQYLSREEAEQHEKELVNVKRYLVRYDPDLTEGRGFQKEGLIWVHAKHHHQWFAEHYCYKEFGNRIEFVMGTYGSNAITENWSISEIKREVSKDVPLLVKLEEDCIIKIWNNETLQRS